MMLTTRISKDVTEVQFATAGLMIHHDAGTVEAFAHDGITTDADWERVCAELRKLGARLDTDEWSEDDRQWMILTGTF